MNKIVEGLLQSHAMKVVNVFTSGHACPEVFLVERADGTKAVIKTAETPVAHNELLKNLAGYEALVSIGLAHICPDLYEQDLEEGKGYIIMEYCGEDLYSSIQKSIAPAILYSELAERMDEIYSQTVRQESADHTIAAIVEKLGQQYFIHLQHSFGADKRVETHLHTISSTLLSRKYEYSCFASWDFTPGNVCLSEKGVKYIDCNDKVLGIPTIDLACFAGVTRDAYALPGSTEGYEVLKKLATTQVARLLRMEDQETEDLFMLGHALQLFLSARFRIKSDFQRAKDLYTHGVECLEKIHV